MNFHGDLLVSSTVVVFRGVSDRLSDIWDWIQCVCVDVEWCATRADVFRTVGRLKSGVVLLDGASPECLDIIERITRIPAAPPVMMVSETVEFNDVVRAFRCGAFDVLDQPLDRRYFVDRLVLAARTDLARAHQRILYERLRRLIASLTPRELQVMHSVVGGRANKKIAADLGISQKTVEVHRHKVMRKMEADSLAELVRMNVVMEATSAGVARLTL